MKYFKYLLLISLFTFVVQNFAYNSEENVLVNKFLVGTAEAVSGDTFKFNITKKCDEYWRSIECTICKKLSKRDKTQLRLIEEEIEVIPQKKMYDRVKYCLECREKRDKKNNLLGEECSDNKKEEYIKLVDITAPHKNSKCEGKGGEVFECGKNSLEAFQEVLKGQEIRCEADQLTSMVKDAKLVVVRECKVKNDPLNALILKTGWVYLDFGAKLSLQEIDKKNKKDKIGIWEFKEANDERE